MNFQELSKRISPVLKRITRRLSVYPAYYNHEDLFQEAMIHLWQDFNKGKLADKTDSYILQGCFFYLKNYIRVKKTKAKTVSIDSIINEDGQTLEEALFLRDKHSDDYLDNLNDRMLADTLHNNGFTPREKKILRFYAEGLTTREIGSRLGVSHVRVVKMTRIIRQKSRIYLD